MAPTCPPQRGSTDFFNAIRTSRCRTPMSLGKERAMVTHSKVESWFEGLRAHILSQDPSLIDDPSRIFNSDESGFSFDPKSRKVITCKGAKTVYSIAASNIRTQVTVLACMSAAELYLPPLLIYPYKRIPGKNLLDGFPEALLQVSDNGWIKSAIFFSWIRDSFIPATRHIKKPLLLLVDGHVSHKSLVETSQLCQGNGVILYCLPAHASHLVQPLDQAFFGSIKFSCRQPLNTTLGRRVMRLALTPLLKSSNQFGKALPPQQMLSLSYRAAGIFPFSPQRLLQTTKNGPLPGVLGLSNSIHLQRYRR